MRGGISVKGAAKTAWDAATTSGPDTAQQTGTIVVGPWKDIAEGNDCSLTNGCNRGVITTPMSVVDKAYGNLPKHFRSLSAIEDDKHLTARQRQTYESKLAADTAKLDGL